MLVLLHVGPEDDLVFPDDDPGVEASSFCLEVLLEVFGDFLLNMMMPENDFHIKKFCTLSMITTYFQCDCKRPEVTIMIRTRYFLYSFLNMFH